MTSDSSATAPVELASADQSIALQMAQQFVLARRIDLRGFVILARASALWMVYLSRIIDGATAGNLSLVQAYIADHTAPENRTRSLALIGIAFGIGFFIASFVWLFVSPLGPDAWRYMYLIGVLPALLTLWIRRAIPESEMWEKAKARRDGHEVWYFRYRRR